MVDVSYYCPRCGAVAELDRDPYLADKSVTPFPLEGWTYVSPADEGAERSSAESASGDKPRAYEGDDADGVKFVCGADAAEWSHPPREAERGGCLDCQSGERRDPRRTGLRGAVLPELRAVRRWRGSQQAARVRVREVGGRHGAERPTGAERPRLLAVATP